MTGSDPTLSAQVDTAQLAPRSSRAYAATRAGRRHDLQRSRRRRVGNDRGHGNGPRPGERQASEADRLLRVFRQRRGRADPGRVISSTHLPFPKEKLVANLEFEMIGRPDAKVKPDELWLTGYERSNLGPELARRGAKLRTGPASGPELLPAVRQLHARETRDHRSHGLELRPAHGLSSRERRNKNDRLRTYDEVDQLDGQAGPVAREFQFRARVERGQEALADT